jgi:hypothetical protein
LLIVEFIGSILNAAIIISIFGDSTYALTHNFLSLYILIFMLVWLC